MKPVKKAETYVEKFMILFVNFHAITHYTLRLKTLIKWMESLMTLMGQINVILFTAIEKSYI